MGSRTRTWRRSILAAAGAWRRGLVTLLAGTLVVIGLLTIAPAASAADTADPALLVPCRYRSSFGGQHFCLVDAIERVQGTAYGTDKRVYLQVVVERVTATTVTFDQVRWSSACNPGPYCGQVLTISFVRLTVPRIWRYPPPVGYVVRLYGTTTAGSLEPAGYVNTRTYCGADWNLCL